MAHKLGYNVTVFILKTKLLNGPIRSTMLLRDNVFWVRNLLILGLQGPIINIRGYEMYTNMQFLM